MLTTLWPRTAKRCSRTQCSPLPPARLLELWRPSYSTPSTSVSKVALLSHKPSLLGRARWALGCSDLHKGLCEAPPVVVSHVTQVDIVRMSTTPAGASHFAFGTAPFMSAYLGLYFLQPLKDRQSKPLSQKAGWAVAATASAVAVELPFDKAKINMAGGAPWSNCPLGSPPARSMCLLNARLVALGNSVLPERGPATGRPATATGAQASRLQSRRFHCLSPSRWRGARRPHKRAARPARRGPAARVRPDRDERLKAASGAPANQRPLTLSTTCTVPMHAWEG